LDFSFSPQRQKRKCGEHFQSGATARRKKYDTALNVVADVDDDAHRVAHACSHCGVTCDATMQKSKNETLRFAAWP
jgi:hypothetical protein